MHHQVDWCLKRCWAGGSLYSEDSDVNTASTRWIALDRGTPTMSCGAGNAETGAKGLSDGFESRTWC
jgi:hypothetical protein